MNTDTNTWKIAGAVVLCGLVVRLGWAALKPRRWRGEKRSILDVWREGSQECAKDILRILYAPIAGVVWLIWLIRWGLAATARRRPSPHPGRRAGRWVYLVDKDGKDFSAQIGALPTWLDRLSGATINNAAPFSEFGWQVGERLQDWTWGDGTVRQVDGDRLTVDFDQAGMKVVAANDRKRSIPGFAWMGAEARPAPEGESGFQRVRGALEARRQAHTSDAPSSSGGRSAAKKQNTRRGSRPKGNAKRYAESHSAGQQE